MKAEITEQGGTRCAKFSLSPQPGRRVWQTWRSSPELRAIVQMASPGAEWIFVGCGTSYYLAQAAAATFNYLKLPARAVPASDLLMYPELTLHAQRTLHSSIDFAFRSNFGDDPRRPNAGERTVIFDASPSPAPMASRSKSPAA